MSDSVSDDEIYYEQPAAGMCPWCEVPTNAHGVCETHGAVVESTYPCYLEGIDTV